MVCFVTRVPWTQRLYQDIKTYQDFKRVKRGDQKQRVQFLPDCSWLTFNLRHPHRRVAFLCKCWVDVKISQGIWWPLPLERAPQSKSASALLQSLQWRPMRRPRATDLFHIFPQCAFCISWSEYLYLYYHMLYSCARRSFMHSFFILTELML